MKYTVVGITVDNDNNRYHLGISFANSLAEVTEQVAWALWVDKCVSVSVEENKE